MRFPPSLGLSSIQFSHHLLNLSSFASQTVPLGARTVSSSSTSCQLSQRARRTCLLFCVVSQFCCCFCRLFSPLSAPLHHLSRARLASFAMQTMLEFGVSRGVSTCVPKLDCFYSSVPLSCLPPYFLVSVFCPLSPLRFCLVSAWSLSHRLPSYSQTTLEFHWGKHHRTYVTKLNELIQGKPEAKKSLKEIITTRGMNQQVFNNAAQVSASFERVRFLWICLPFLLNSVVWEQEPHYSRHERE